MNKSQAGRLGGLALVEKHGVDHMKEIGRRGAASFHSRYRLEPFGTCDFAVVDRETGRKVSTLNGYHWRSK